MVAEYVSGSIRKKKNIIGMIAITLLLLFTALAIARVLTFVEWIIADLIVAVIANLILKTIGKQRQ
jgi:hypothetical protein